MSAGFWRMYRSWMLSNMIGEHAATLKLFFMTRVLLLACCQKLSAASDFVRSLNIV